MSAPLPKNATRITFAPNYALVLIVCSSHAGPRGSVESACTLSHGPRTTWADGDRAFGPGEGLTIVVALPKGLLDEPSRLRRWLDRASDYASTATDKNFSGCAIVNGIYRCCYGNNPYGGKLSRSVRIVPQSYTGCRGPTKTRPLSSTNRGCANCFKFLEFC